MKRLSFLVLFLLSVFATNVFAESEVSVWGGYSRLLNADKQLDKELGISRGSNIDSETKVKGSLDNAFTVGLDYFYGDYENVKPGFRVSYLRSSKKISVKVPEIYNVFTHLFKVGEFAIVPTNSLISFMPGVKLNFDISEKFSLNGKLFAGIASMKHGAETIVPFVMMENIIPAAVGKKVSTATTTSASDSEYKFAMDASVGAQYLLTKTFGLGLDLGYRPFPARLSGFTATLGLNFKI